MDSAAAPKIAFLVANFSRALSKTSDGLTQAQVGAALGVSQARIAEIEANPGLVNFDQLLQLLAYPGCNVCLELEVAKSAQ